MVVVGMDSMKDDGIYTGFISSHQIYGAGGKYFSFSVSSSNLVLSTCYIISEYKNLRVDFAV